MIALTQLLIAIAAFAFSETALSLDADCYDKGEDYYIPAKDLLEAKKKYPQEYENAIQDIRERYEIYDRLVEKDIIEGKITKVGLTHLAKPFYIT